MANELSFSYLTGQTIKALVWGKNRTTRWNGSAMAATSTIVDSAWTTGMATMTELLTADGTGTGQYVGDLPATGVIGEHQVDYLLGASPTPGQERIGYQSAILTDELLLFESTVVSYETSEFGTNLYIEGGPDQNNCFAYATVVVYDASNSNAPSFRQAAISELSDGDTYLSISPSAFDFTPVAGDLVRIFLNPREISLRSAYDAAKTAASATALAAVQTHGDTTWATATTVGLSDIDGIDWEVAMASMLAHAVGVSEVTDSVVEFKRRDGLTTVATVTMGNTAGTRTTSVLVGE